MSGTTTASMTLPGVYVIDRLQGEPTGKLQQLVDMWRHPLMLAALVGVPMFGAAIMAARYSVLVITSPLSFAPPALNQNLPQYFLSGVVMAAMGLVFLVRHSEKEQWLISLHFGGFGGLVVGFLATYQL